MPDCPRFRRRLSEGGRVANFEQRLVGKLAGTFERPLAQSPVGVGLDFPSNSLAEEVFVPGAAWLIPDLDPFFLKLFNSQIPEGFDVFGDFGLILSFHLECPFPAT